MAPPDAMRTVRDTGGTLFVQQLKAAGVKYYFFNPSTGDAPIFDAIVNEPSIQLIKGVQEGVVVGMADGYARLSGKTGVCSIANVGLPNGMTQLVNTYKDRIPLLLVIASFGSGSARHRRPARLRSSRKHAAAAHQVVLARAIHRRHSGNHAPRAQVRVHAADGTGVSRDSRRRSQPRRQARRSWISRCSICRCAFAPTSRCRDGREDADRGEKSAAVGRR
jgi:hypothetical protein